MNLRNVIIAICSILFLMIGLDKFLNFLEPPCSLMNSIAPSIWKSIGVLQIAGGILIWIPKLRKYVAGFFVAFMLTFTIYHLTQSTYDIGGSASMAAMLALLVWNPTFIGGKTTK